MDKMDQELQNHQKKIRFQGIKESRFAIGLILVFVIVLSWKIYKSSDKLIANEKTFGVLNGIHQVQTKLGSSTTILSVKLANGENVLVTAPANLVVIENAKVEVIRGKTKQGSIYYYFSGYRNGNELR